MEPERGRQCNPLFWQIPCKLVALFAWLGVSTKPGNPVLGSRKTGIIMSGHFTSGQCQYKVIVWSWIALNFEVVPGRGVMPPQFDLQTFLDAGGSSQPQRNTLRKDNVHRTPVAGRQQLQLQRYDVTESESESRKKKQRGPTGGLQRYEETEDSTEPRPESEESSSSSSGSSSMSRSVVWGQADLSLERMECLHSVRCDGDREMDTYSKNGVKPGRIQKACKNPCSCEGGCSVPRHIMKKVCECFWSLSKAGQDGLLWSLQQGAGKKRHYSITGYAVCREAFMHPGCRRLWAFCANLYTDCAGIL